ncbi:MAG: hypothetical protein ACKVU2_11230, partial [Saprospiraceae bacterium]
MEKHKTPPGVCRAGSCSFFTFAAFKDQLKSEIQEIMAKKERRTEFVKWMGPTLDALRDFGDSCKP